MFNGESREDEPAHTGSLILSSANNSKNKHAAIGSMHTRDAQKSLLLPTSQE